MKKTDKIKFGIIGFGMRGKGYAGVVKQFPELELVAVSDNNEGCLKDYRLDAQVMFHKDYRELLKNKNIDCVFIATRDYQHAGIILDALKNKKHIICEKPIAVTAADCNKIHKAVMDSNRIFLVGHVLRYSPFFRKMKKLVEQGEVGKIHQAQIIEEVWGGYLFYHDWHRKKENVNSLLLQKGCHSLDAINWILNDIPETVAAFGDLSVYGGKENNTKRCDNSCKRYDTCPESFKTIESLLERKTNRSGYCVFAREVDVDDNSVLIVRYKGGAKLVMLDCQFAPEHHRSFWFWGDKGKIGGNWWDREILLKYRASKDYVRFQTFTEGKHGGGDQGLTRAFITAFQNKKVSRTELNEAYYTNLIAIAAQKSIESKKMIKISDLMK